MVKARTEFIQEFNGESVVLLALDSAGLKEFVADLSEAIQTDLGPPTVQHYLLDHSFIIGNQDDSIELKGLKVIWRLSKIKADEILAKAKAMGDTATPDHNYIDIHAPAKILVISKDQYV